MILLFIPLLFGLVVGLSSCGSEEKTAEVATADKLEESQLWTCGMHPEVIVDEPGQCPKCGMNLVPVKSTSAGPQGQEQPEGERQILYWQAPMNPTEIYDEPGKSKMGMDLIPVYDDQATLGAGGSIRIDPVTVQNMGVRTTMVERGDFTRSIRTVGKIEYNEEKLYIVNTKISGWIERLFVNYVGEMLRKGDPLLEIYSPELVTTQEEYLLALNTQRRLAQSNFETVREGAESLLESSRTRLLYWDIPISEIERLEKSGEVKKTVQLESPATGMVVHKNAVEGLHVKEGTSLYQIADLSTIWVHASVYDYELPWIRDGQTAQMELSYLPGKTFEGKVAYVYPYLREKARDVHVRLEFPNPGLELKIGMYANIDIQAPTIRDAVVIPTEAVIRSGARNVVFVARGEGRFEPRQVMLGEEGDNGKIRVVSGLLGNEEVVTSAQFLLDSESRLQEVIQKLLAEKQQKTQKMDMKDKATEEQKEMEQMDSMEHKH
jgi:Cu(I)/Ag(I) efflux system membrane fusion protein/cobalt-zinc-cadmium efflux system membrane fusion protein